MVWSYRERSSCMDATNLKKEGMGVYIIYPRARGGSGITPGYSGNSNQPSPYISS